MTIRLGLVDCDTSHVVAFTQRLNHLEVSSDHWVDGAQVVAACPGVSIAAPERIPGFVEQLRAYDVPLVDQPTDLIGQVDAVLLTSLDGSVHLERALPFLQAGMPLFVDKPFACSVSDAQQLLAAAAEHRVLMWSASSLRYVPELADIRARSEEVGKVVGAATFGPGSQHPRNPGLFHYGVHGVELLYELLGTGCDAVRMVSNEGTDVAIGQWSDGRIGTVRGVRSGTYAFGMTAFGQRQTVATTVATDTNYRELLKLIVAAFQSGQSPLSPAEMLEPVAFQEAALHSAQRGGDEVRLATAG